MYVPPGGMNLLLRNISASRDQAMELMQVIAEEERGKCSNWEDEKPALEGLVASLTASYDIVKASGARIMLRQACLRLHA